MKTLLTALPLVFTVGFALAQANPTGLWKTIDDKTGKERSLIRITEGGGVYSGHIEKRLDPDAKPTDVCDKCSDERKDKPVLGMTILRNLRETDDKGVWGGGEILDPNDGKTYRTRLKPVEGGRKLEMRGYIGPFYRTQVWIRVE